MELDSRAPLGTPFEVPQRDRQDVYELPVVLRRHVGSLRDKLQTFGLDSVQTNRLAWCQSLKEWYEEVTKFGFCSVFTLGKQVLVISAPEGKTLIYTRKEKDDFRLPQIVGTVFRNPAICKVTLNYQETRDVVSEFLRDEHGPLVSLKDLDLIASKHIPSAEIGEQGCLDFFRQTVDGKILSFPATFNTENEGHLKAVVQAARASVYAVWLITYRWTGSLGLERSANMIAYTRELFWESSYMGMIDGYYVKSEDITLKPLHKTRLNMLDECRDINLSVWKKDTPAYRFPWAEDFTYAVSGICRFCGIAPSKTPGKSLAKHPCAGHKTCGYPFCHDTSDHSIITCDALRAWCLTCRRRGHIATDHDSDNFSRTYADHLFRIFSLKGHDTGYVYSSEKLSLNERHWRFTLYGLSSIEVPKAALEFFLNPAIPAGMKPPPPPPKSKVVKEKKKPAKGKSVATSSTSQPSSSRSSPNKSRSLISKSEKKPEKSAKKEKKFSSPSKPKVDKSKVEKSSPKVKQGRVVKPKNVPLDNLSFTKALHLAGRISRGEIVGTPTLLKNKLVQLALMQFESMKTFTKVKLTAGEEVPMVALPSLAKPSTSSSTIVRPPSHGEEAMETEVVTPVLPAPEVKKDPVVASVPSTSGKVSVKAKPIVDDLTEMLNPIRVQPSKTVEFDKLATIPEGDDPMEQPKRQPTAQDEGLLDHQEGEDLPAINEEDIKLLDRTDENEPMNDNKTDSEEDPFDP